MLGTKTHWPRKSWSKFFQLGKRLTWIKKRGLTNGEGLLLRRGTGGCQKIQNKGRGEKSKTQEKNIRCLGGAKRLVKKRTEGEEKIGQKKKKNLQVEFQKP